MVTDNDTTVLCNHVSKNILGLSGDRIEAFTRMWESGAKEKLHIAHMVIDVMEDRFERTAMAVNESGGNWIVIFQKGAEAYEAGEGAFPMAVLRAALNSFPPKP